MSFLNTAFGTLLLVVSPVFVIFICIFISFILYCTIINIFLFDYLIL